MNKKLVRIAAILVGFLGFAANAATDWSTQDYDLYPGDFDGDGKTDLLYVAKDASKASGIARSDGSAPNIPFQSWPSNYLGIPWYGNQYAVIVADFNGDQKADLLLQRATAGDSYLLFADASGKITAVSQTIANTAVALHWSADQHRILAGDFNNDGKADLFFQATRSTAASGTAATNAVVLADAAGQFTGSLPAQTWTDATWSAFKWSTQNSNIFVGDFNGDGKKDLVVQARPKFVLVDYDVAIPVPTYPPNMNGVVISQGGATPFQPVGVQQWSRMSNGVDWSPLTSTVIVGDFNGDGRADVMLQSRASTRPSYLLTGNASGAPFATGTALATNATWSSDTFRLLAGNFDGTGGAGIYFQSVTSTGTNYYANVVTGGTVTQTAHNPGAATGVLPTTAVGHTVGSFAVGDNGAATYSIPIVVPPGVAGMQPQLSINYASGGGNGLLGVGWGIGGLSAIARCAKTIAQDGVVGAVTLTLSDRFCLDGNKLRRTSGTYGAAGSTYQTEMETFARVTATGTGVNGPQYFIVEGKDGLRYEYGNSADSRIESLNPSATTTVHTWALNRVSDRHGNSMTISYQKDGSPNGSYRPNTISYTSNTGLTAAYRVVFFWDLRQSSDMPRMYVAGGQVIERYRLNRIETQYNDPAVGTWRLVRKYQLSYNVSGATPRSRLGAVQECDRNGACLAPTVIGWQDGLAGWSASGTTSSSNSGAMMQWSFAIDVNGDGRDDLVYPQTVGLTTYWHYMTANGSGGFNSPVNTSINAGDSTMLQYTRAVPIDYFSEGRAGLLVDAPGFSTRQILRWNGSTLALTNTNISVTLMGKEWVADFDGDGRQDFLYATTSGTNGLFQVQKNSGSTSAPAQFAAATTFYSIPNGQNASPFVGWYSNAYARLMDFNGDGRSDMVYSDFGASCGGDICTYTTVFRALISTGTSFTNSAFWTCDQIGSPCSMSPIVADFNGDGLSDVMTLVGDISGSSWSIAYGSGAGLTTPVAISPPGGLYDIVVDYNGDGRADILYNSGGSLAVAISNGTGFDAGPVIPLAATLADNTLRLLDLDGDGQEDIGYKDAQYRVRKHNGMSPDFVSSITDGFGNSVAIQYAPLTDSTVYTTCPVNPQCPAAAQFPIVEVQPAAHVVKSFTGTDGVGGLFTVSQKYTGLRVHMQGRGLLGFAAQESIDSRTGIKTTTTFRQDFPYIGFESQKTAYQPNGTSVISQVNNTPAELAVQGGTNEERRFPYMQQSAQTTYEVGGPGNTLPVASVTTTQSLDTYGNVTGVTTATVDLTGSNQSFQTATANTYAPADLVNWCVDFVTRQTITNTVQGLAGSPRTVEYTKDADPTKCRVYEQIVEPNDNTVKLTTTFGYDTFGHVNSQTVAAVGIASRTTTMSYGTQGVFPVSKTDALLQVDSKTYDFALGVVKSATDANLITTLYDYDGFGRPTRQTRPDGTKREFVYSSCTAGNGYCGDNRLRYQVETRELDTASQVVRFKRALSDGFDRTLYEQSQGLSGALSTVATNYDNQGRVSQHSKPYFTGEPVYFTTHSYDLLGRTVQEQRRISESDANLQDITYSYNRLIQTLEDANDKVTIKELNAIGQVVKVTDPANGITRYEYDHFGNLTKTIDPANNQVVNTFNIRAFKLTTNDPDMGNWIYEYFPTGEVKKQTDAKGQIVTLTYDKVGRLLTRTEPEGTTTFNYGTSATAHNIGKVESVGVVPGAFSESFTYDSLGRLQDATSNIDGTAYIVSRSYSATSGALETVTYPTSTSAVPGSRFKVQYEYASGLLKRVRDFHTPATTYWEQVAADASGRAIDEQFGNGLHTYSTFDPVNDLLGEITTGATSQVQDLMYQWDKVGNLKQRKDLVPTTDLTEDFYYDNLYRLDYSRLNGVATPNLDMTYDAIGNITAKAEGASSSSYTYTTQQAGCTYNFTHAQPHAVRKVGTTVYCYDENGNMVKRGGSNITWFSYNLPNRIDHGSNYAQFFYGTDRSRYKQIAFTASGGVLPAGTETTLYVRGLFERVTKPSGVIEYKNYVLAGNSPVAIRTLRSNGANDTRYLHKDHLGNVDTVTNEAASVVLRLSYDAFGKRRNPAGWSGAVPGSDWTLIAALTHRGFTQHEHLDNVELVHMNGRVYDPNIGRFISADPFIQAPLLSQSLNRYSYVMNNPLSLIDPSGYSWVSKTWKKFRRWASRQWDSIRRNVNYIAAAFLVVVGTVVNYFVPGAGTPFYGWAQALIQSPVQVRRGRDGYYVSYGYAGFGGDTRAGPTLTIGSGTPPPMTAPAGAVSLAFGGAVKEFFNAVKEWYSRLSMPDPFINYENPDDRGFLDPNGIPVDKKVRTAVNVVLIFERERLPPMSRGLIVYVTAGGSDYQAEAEYNPHQGFGKITLMGAVMKFGKNQSEANSLTLHEMMHIEFEAEGKLTVDEQHQRIYRAQWDLRNDPRFKLTPNRDYGWHVYSQCLKYHGGCVLD